MPTFHWHTAFQAITIGITHGGNAHGLDEYIETAPVANGLRELIVLALVPAPTKHLGGI